jgi:hypothetical protein
VFGHKGGEISKKEWEKVHWAWTGTETQISIKFGANLSFILSFFLDCLQPITVIAVCTAAINIFKP